MESYQLLDDVYRIPGGYGSDGEIYGGILIDTEPPVVIGASGGRTFIRNLSELISNKRINDTFRIYLPTVNWQEIITLEEIQKKWPSPQFYIHKDIASEVEQPRKSLFQDRFQQMREDGERQIKQLPSQLKNVMRISKAHSFETSTTKILIIPFQGPHKGHTFIYSRDHKLLFSGIMLGLTSDPNYFYIDRTGSFLGYEGGLSFLKQARSDIIVPSYDEPKFISKSKIDVEPIQNIIDYDRKSVYDLTSQQWKPFGEIAKDYSRFYGPTVDGEVFTSFNLIKTRLFMQLSKLIDEEKIIEKEGEYRRK